MGLEGDLLMASLGAILSAPLLHVSVHAGLSSSGSSVPWA